MKLLTIMAAGVFAAGNLMADEDALASQIWDLERKVSALENKLDGDGGLHASVESVDERWSRKIKETGKEQVFAEYQKLDEEWKKSSGEKRHQLSVEINRLLNELPAK